jgi:hypothetical protein
MKSAFEQEIAPSSLETNEYFRMNKSFGKLAGLVSETTTQSSRKVLPVCDWLNHWPILSTPLKDALTSIAKSEGIGALWAGAAPTVVRAMALNFGQLAFFSEAKAQLKANTDLSARTQTLSASAIAGFFASFFSLPFDFVKTRLQKQQKGPDGKVPYKGMADCFVKVAKQEGVLRFYRGFGTYYVRIAPHAMVTLIVADYLGWLTK